MKQLNRLEKEWIAMLDNEDDIIVLTTLHEIKNSGSVRMLPYIINLLATTQKDHIRDNILQFIGAIKAQEAVPHIIEALKNLERNSVFSDLLSACWQSGLDFSEHLPIFANIFVRSDYQASLEVFTIIEESLPYADEKMKTECLVQLQSSCQSIPENKVSLLRELMKIIQE